MDKRDFIDSINAGGTEFTYYKIDVLKQQGLAEIDRLPFSIRILVENLLRKLDGRVVTEEDLLNIARWQKKYDTPLEIPFHPGRVLMQDFTGVPAVVDLAAMRDAMAELGGDPKAVNPLVPVELVIDHSVQVDYFGSDEAAALNVEKEYERNGERYAFLKWAQKSFENFKVVPPRSGICHQVNLEHLARVVMDETSDQGRLAFPDTLVGLDSHTTMVNGLGVLGWGVGGIEAEAVMLGQAYSMSIPEVIGFRLTGELSPGATATDMVLTITEMLRKYGVVEKFVEFTGPGVKKLSLPDRATISNMTPEFGATLSFFPVDQVTVDYLAKTGRVEYAKRVEAYTKANGMFYIGTETPEYTDMLELDLSTVKPCVSGPARPQDRIPIEDLPQKFADILGCEYKRDESPARISQFHDESGTQTSRPDDCKPVSGGIANLMLGNTPVNLTDGSVVIAAITSCTNTSNPTVLIGAGLLAKNAVKYGIKPPAYVKTSMAPGSTVVPRYLNKAGLMPYFKALGFHLAAFGCTTCIGNSGPLHPEIEKIIDEKNLNVAAVLSGNRNFEARIHQKIKSNFLASPMLVVAYALAGRVDLDLTKDPVALDPNGRPVYLNQLWPSQKEIRELVGQCVSPVDFEEEYAKVFEGDELWKSLPDVESLTYAWDPASTYIKNPPYFKGFSMEPTPPSDVEGAKALVVVGDSVTTDHISPAGAIPEEYPAGQYLVGKGVAPAAFNSYGSRRGNHEVMMRGTFGNIRLKNKLVDGKEGSFTRRLPESREMYVYEAAMDYADNNIPLVVLGGLEYGTGSSRDWAAKGTTLLGIKAVIVGSFERIHRSNLVGMGVLPLQFKEGETYEKLGVDGTETFSISGLDRIKPLGELTVKADKPDGSQDSFDVIVRLNSLVEIDFFKHGGILPYVLRKMNASS